jgi:hypothetical protein
MRTERGDALTKHPLAVVSLLAFLVGGAAAVVLNYPQRHAVASQQVAVTPADAALLSAPETDASATRPAEVEHAEERTTSGDFDGSAAPPEETSGEAEDDFDESEAAAGNSPAGVRRRRRPAASEQAVQSPPAPRPYVSVSRRQTNPGGRVAGYTVGGVKKTGQGVKKAGTTIGRTFGKIGGVFND